MSEGWTRLHPLSPVVRLGRAAIAIFVLLLPAVFGGNIARDYPQLGVVALLGLIGFVNWLVTRWRIDGDDLRIETGVLRRQSLRYPLKQVQAIDIVRPGLARMFRVAELRLRMGGATGGTARLAYLNEREVEPLRARLLALAHGGEDAEAPTPEEDDREEVLATLLWRRFNQEYHFSLARGTDGLRLRGGLVALSAETVRPGRVQAVRMVEPFIWRRLGWCRLELDLAGRQRRKGEDETTGRQLRALLPVGSRALALELLELVVPDAPQPTERAPRRVLWKSPLRYRFLAWGRSDRAVVAQSGRIRRVTVWLPLEKVQSLRRVEGPLQRRLRLASVHLDTAGRALHATLRDRDRSEADAALSALIPLARAARRAPP